MALFAALVTLCHAHLSEMPCGDEVPILVVVLGADACILGALLVGAVGEAESYQRVGASQRAALARLSRRVACELADVEGMHADAREDWHPAALRELRQLRAALAAALDELATSSHSAGGVFGLLHAGPGDGVLTFLLVLTEGLLLLIMGALLLRTRCAAAPDLAASGVAPAAGSWARLGGLGSWSGVGELSLVGGGLGNLSAVDANASSLGNVGVLNVSALNGSNGSNGSGSWSG